MLEFLAVGAFGFWLLLTVECLFLLTIIVREWSGWVAAGSIVLTGAILQFVSGVNILGFAWEHPILLGVGFVLYFFTGAAWCLPKWRFFNTDLRQQLKDEKLDFLRANKVQGDTIPEELKKKWFDLIRYRHDFQELITEGGHLHPRNHKARIARWITYWPWSLAWTMLNDPIRKLVRRIYDSLQGLLLKISQQAFSDLADDLTPPPPSDDEGGGDGDDPMSHDRVAPSWERHDLDIADRTAAPNPTGGMLRLEE